MTPRPIFAIFEGGGAKGVAHVGALKAIEESGFEVIGTAGTSAGALLAVLAAIGLQADDILDPRPPGVTILSRFGMTPVGLLGEKDWKRLKKLSAGWRLAAGLAFFFGPLVNSALSPRVTGTVLTAGSKLGHFSSSAIRNFVNKVIKDRLETIAKEAGLVRPVPEAVTFGELGSGWPTVVPLKIVVTDVDRGTLEIFDAQRTPDVVVAEAVAASISIPIVFQPAAIASFRPGRFADGGLVSNFPVWVFFEEKLAHERQHPADPPVPVVGFSLGAPAPEPEVAAEGGLPAYLKKLIDASLQGSQGAAARFLDDVLVVPLETELGLLAFDEGWDEYCAAFEAGRRRAATHLRFNLGAKPDRIRCELEAVRNHVERHIATLRARDAVAPLRVALVRPHSAHSLRVMESANMADDADDRLLIDRRGGLAAQTFRGRGLGVFRIAGGQAYMTKYERALLRPTVKTALCVPIFRDSTAWKIPESSRPEPAGVLVIDSDEDLVMEFGDATLWDVLVERSAVLYEAVSLEVRHA